MTVPEAQPYVGQLPDSTWDRLVSELHGATATAVVVESSEQLWAGAGAGSSLFRVTGTARAGSGVSVDWSLVVKFLTPQYVDPGDAVDARGFQSTSADPSVWDYWKREWDVYRSPWLGRLPGPFVAARGLGTGELRSSDSSRLIVWLAMEDLGDFDVRPWSLQQFVETARHVGQFNGYFLDGRMMPQDPWLSRQWIAGWAEQATGVIEHLESVDDRSQIAKIYPADVINDLRSVWRRRQDLIRALDDLPQTLCHNDAFPRNVFVRGTGDYRRSVAIDWAFTGPAALGQDIALMIGSAQAFFESPPPEWDRLEHASLASYVDGLRHSCGWSGSPADIELGYLASYVLYNLGTLSPVLEVILDPEQHEAVAMIFGRPYEEVIDVCAAVSQFNQRRIKRAWNLLDQHQKGVTRSVD